MAFLTRQLEEQATLKAGGGSFQWEWEWKWEYPHSICQFAKESLELDM